MKNIWNHHPDWNFQELCLAVRFRAGGLRHSFFVGPWHTLMQRCGDATTLHWPNYRESSATMAQQVFGALSGVMFLLDEIPENTWFSWSKNGYLISASQSVSNHFSGCKKCCLKKKHVKSGSCTITTDVWYVSWCIMYVHNSLASKTSMHLQH